MRTWTRLTLAGSVLASLLAACAPTAGPTTVRRDPVVIVAGTYASGPIADVAYAPLSGRLSNDGYATYVFGLPDFGLGDIAHSADELRGFVAGVLASTGAAHVDLIGHSQGGLVARYFVKNLGGDAVVDSLIALSTPNYGANSASLATLLGLGSCFGALGCAQMSVGSDFLTALNSGDDTIGAVQYTNLATTLDLIVTPYSSAFLTQADGNVANVTVQDQCPLRVVGHITMATDGTVYTGIRHALRHEPVWLDCLAI